METIKQLQKKIKSLDITRRKLGRQKNIIDHKESKLWNEANALQLKIEKIRLKGKIHPVKIGEWYVTDSNPDVSIKILSIRKGYVYVFVVNLQDSTPHIFCTEISQLQFFGNHTKCENPYEAAVKKLKEFM